MHIKFKKRITDYDAILSFDLAKNVTGWSLVKCVWGKEIKFELIDSGIIDTTKFDKDYFYTSFSNAVYRVIGQCYNLIDGNLLVCKEKMPNQCGTFSTIATLQSLAQAHALFGVGLESSGADSYDDEGIAAISEKALIRRISNIEKPTKEDIRAEICKIVDAVPADIDLNISDSIAVTLTLVMAKWGADIKEEIKEVKKKIKSYKSDKKINELNNYIHNLETIKLEVK